MKTIKMVAKIGDLQVSVGTCNSAQARILVRDDLAAWQDGDLMLFIRKAHLALLDSNPEAWRCKADDDNVSEAEMDRRKAWFISFMPLAAKALTHKQGSERAEIHAVALQMVGSVTTRNAPYEGVAPALVETRDPHKSGVPLWASPPRPEMDPTPSPNIRPMFGATDEGNRDIKDILQDPSLDEVTKDKFRAVAKHFGCDPEDSHDETTEAMVDAIMAGENVGGTPFRKEDEDKLQSLWETSPDVSNVFGVPGPIIHSPVDDDDDDWDIELEGDDEQKMYAGPGLSQLAQDDIDAQEGSIIRIPAEFILSKRSPYLVELAQMSIIEAAKEEAQNAPDEIHAENHPA